MSADSGAVVYSWRGVISNEEVNTLHAEAFETRPYDESAWDWVELCRRHSLGWVAARMEDQLVGFANVLWDGLVHAFLEDVMVASDTRHRGIGVGLVQTARDGARQAGCEYLHVGFAPELKPFYVEACGFTEVGGGLQRLAPD